MRIQKPNGNSHNRLKFAIAVFIAAFNFYNAFSQPSECTLTVGSATACPGDTISIPLSFSGLNQPNVSAISLMLEVSDTSVLEFLDISDVHASFPSPNIFYWPGDDDFPPSIWYSWTSGASYPAVTAGTLLNLRFKYKRSASAGLVFPVGWSDIVDGVSTPYSLILNAGNVGSGTLPSAVTVGTSGTALCAGSNIDFSGNATNGTVWSKIAWNWTGPDGFASSSQNPTIASLLPAKSGRYSLIASNNCGDAAAVTSDFIAVSPTGAWQGSSNSDWFNSANWCLSGNVPSVTTDIQILQVGSPFHPLINSTGAVCRNITINSGTLDISGTNNLTVYGNWDDNGTFNPGAGTVAFAGSAAQSISGNSHFSNLEVNNSSGLSIIGAPQISDSLILKLGEISDASGISLAENATITRYLGSFDEAPSFNNKVNIVYRNPVTTGPEIPTAGNILQLLQVNTGDRNIVELGSAAYINASVSFISGALRSNNIFPLVFNDGATASGMSATSFVDGPVQKVGDDAFMFPTGDIQGTAFIWAPIEMSDPGSNVSDAFTAEYFYKSSPANWEPSDMCYGLDHASGVEYWELIRNMGTNFPDLTLYWKDANRSGINNLSELSVAHYEDCRGHLAWSAMQGTAVDDGGGTGHITGTGFSSYSPVTIGAKNGFSNPLPVELVDFNAQCTGTEIELNWTTASETNNDFFIIQRSNDARHWTGIDTLKGAGNSAAQKDYKWFDRSPLPGISYYRLVQVDYNGNSKTFEPTAVGCFENEQTIISISPNPFRENLFVKFNSHLKSPAFITISDMSGRNVYSEVVAPAANENTTTLILGKLNPGSYLLYIISEEFNQHFSIVKVE
ncbi:MAG: cohesin domain-containing protein [Bacteroidota bacterium]